MAIVDQYIKGTAFASSLDDAFDEMQAIAKKKLKKKFIADAKGNRLALEFENSIVISRRRGGSAAMIACPMELLKHAAKDGKKILVHFVDEDYLLVFDPTEILTHPASVADKSKTIEFSIILGKKVRK